MRPLRFAPEIEIAIDTAAKRLNVTPEAFVLESVKRRLTNMGVVGWESMIEVNTPGFNGRE